MTAAFDTLKLAERLGEGGFTAQQAQAAASALSDVLNIDRVGKPDLEATRVQLDAKITDTRNQLDARITETRLQLEARISETRLYLEAKISESKAEMIKWLVGVVGFQTLVLLSGLFTMLKIFMH